jgi:hypothetical protein
VVTSARVQIGVRSYILVLLPFLKRMFWTFQQPPFFSSPRRSSYGHVYIPATNIISLVYFALTSPSAVHSGIRSNLTCQYQFQKRGREWAREWKPFTASYLFPVSTPTYSSSGKDKVVFISERAWEEGPHWTNRKMVYWVKQVSFTVRFYCMSLSSTNVSSFIDI